MIGICANAILPAFGKDAPDGIVHHLLRRAAGARHLADGLLGKDGRNLAARGTDGPHMAGCGQAQPVAQPGRGAQTQRAGAAARAMASAGQPGVLAGERANQQGSINDRADSPVKKSSTLEAEGQHKSAGCWWERPGRGQIQRHPAESSTVR